MKKRFLSAVLAAAMSAVLMIGCGNNSEESIEDTTAKDTAEEGTEETVVIRLGDQAINMTPYFAYAKETGILDEYFEGYNVEFEVVDFESGPAANEAVAAGQLDFAMMANIPSITGSLGYGEKIIGVGGYSDRWVQLVVPAGSSVETVADLEGGTVGSFIGTINHFYLGQYLADAGLSLDDVNVVNTAGESANAIRNEEVDAAIVSVGNAVVLEQEGSGRVVGEKISVTTPALLILGSDEFTAEYPEYTELLLKAIDATMKKIDEDREAFWEFYEGIVDGDITSIRESWDAMDRTVTHVDAATEDELATLLQWLIDNGLVEDTDAAVENLYDNTYAENAGF